MNDFQKELLNELPADFSDQSKVWIYQSNRPFHHEERVQIDEQLSQMTMQWTAHGEPVKGWGKVMYDRFIILIADESLTQVSGCSTDEMVRLIKSIERQYQVDLFDRTTLTLYVIDRFERLPLQQLKYAIDKGYVSVSDLYFDTSISILITLKEKFILPISQTWLTKYLV